MTTSNALLLRLSAGLTSLPGEIEKIIRTAPLRYKVFSIPKRDGTPREIAQPAREVKAIQRWLIIELRKSLPVHSAVAAYEPGSSIRKNAAHHQNSKYLLKMDLINFFPSIRDQDINRHLIKYCPHYSDQERVLIIKACTWAPLRMTPLRLCIGAPSSPLLSNSILYEFDEALSVQAVQRGVTYTRYADDLTLSSDTKDVLKEFPEIVESLLKKNAYPLLMVNKKKTVHASKAGRRIVTGIILTPESALSIGRDKKRLIRAMYHNHKLGLLTSLEEKRLFGLLAYADDIEAGFSKKLADRYAKKKAQ